MLTPVDVQNKVFKGGIGYDKRDIEMFMGELSADYGQLYRSNIELNDKIAALNESLQHYRSIEDSMRKAMTLSKKTAEETINAANDKARQITIEAEIKAEAILTEAKVELQETKDDIYRLQQQFMVFKKQFSKILKNQLKLLDSDMIDIQLGYDFEPSQYSGDGYGKGDYGNGGGAGYNVGGGMGLGNGGGYYPNSSHDNGYERTNQDPAFDRGSLNMDPFSDAMGVGRFSTHSGGGNYNSHSNASRDTQRNNKASMNSTKSGLNVKAPSSSSTKIKRNFSNMNTTNNANNAVYSNNTNTEHMDNESSYSTPYNVNDTSAQRMTEPHVVPNSTTEASNTTNSNKTENFTKDSYNSTQHGTYENVTPFNSDAKKSMNEFTSAESDIYNKSNDFTTDNVTSSTSKDRTDYFYNEDTVYGDVENKTKESNMLDSEDNYSDGFDFFEDSTSSFVPKDNDTYSGEVENKYNESTMLDSEDNYSDGFNFVSDDTTDHEPSSFRMTSISDDADIYSGEVENKVNESTMLDSEDNYNNDFDFLVNDDDSLEEIPTILSFKAKSFNESNDDVLEGSVEDHVNKSKLIDNFDSQESFNFL